MKRGYMVIFSALLVILAGTVTASAADQITLTFSCHVAQSAWGAQHGLEPWLDRIEAATKGRVKIERYYSQSLVKLSDTLKALRDGVIDMAMIGPGFYPGQQPLTEVSALPFLGATTSEESSVTTWQLYEKFPVLQEENARLKVKPLVFSNCDYHPMTTEKAGPIRVLEDFKGKKLRTIAGPPHEAMLALGASPLYVPAPDLYVSLEKGVIDGANLPWETVGTGWNLAEVTSYQTAVNIFYGVYSISISLSRWNSLPDDVKQQIMSVSGLEGTRYLSSNYFDTAEGPSREVYKKMAAEGKTREVIEVPDEEVQRWAEVGGKPIWDAWVKEMNDKGLPQAEELLKEQLRLIEEFK